MKIQDRKELLLLLCEYMSSEDEQWQTAKHRAYLDNNWFISEFVNLAVQNIVTNFLQPEHIDTLVNKYSVPDQLENPKLIGIIMAGNIPLVGFHDFLCVFISGHKAILKASTKDEALIKQLVKKLTEWNPAVEEFIQLRPMLKGCDAYIATGSNNSGRYFEQYFNKYPHIIRKNRTSVAILTGNESPEELDRLADDVYQYFGLGCRNVTKLFVPEGYNFIPLLEAFRKYDYLINHNKYKNNYDYHLAVHIINNRYYMSNGSLLLIEEESPFSPISELHYEYYKDIDTVRKKLHDNDAIQCIIGKSNTDFGKAQIPEVCDFADGVDTMDFLKKLY